MRNIEVRSSPHHNSRRGHTVDGVVIHYTATEDAEHAIRWFENPDAKVSAHFVIDTDGAITSCVPLSGRAWHAGKGEMPGSDGETRHDPNTWTIGIELANAGKLIVKGGAFFRKIAGSLVPYGGPKPVAATLIFEDGKKIGGHWAPYTDEQIDALAWLLDEIAADFGEEVARNVMGHEEIARPLGRKIDPGPLFPWHRIKRNADRTTKGIEEWGKVKPDLAPPPVETHGHGEAVPILSAHATTDDGSDLGDDAGPE